jgi:hypothetical protein
VTALRASKIPVTALRLGWYGFKSDVKLRQNLLSIVNRQAS